MKAVEMKFGPTRLHVKDQIQVIDHRPAVSTAACENFSRVAYLQSRAVFALLFAKCGTRQSGQQYCQCPPH
jgi:hypothetical protein